MVLSDFVSMVMNLRLTFASGMNEKHFTPKFGSFSRIRSWIAISSRRT